MPAIPKEKIDQFFRKLAEKAPATKGTIYVTGGAALILYGIPRFTEDIDMEIPLELSEGDILSAAKEVGVIVEFGVDIERWGMTSLFHYRENAAPYQEFGGLTVKIVDPLNIIAPKLARFIERDIEDAVILIQKFEISRQDILSHLEKIYQRSPVSLEKGQLRGNVVRFLKEYQKTLWGKEDPLPAWLNIASTRK
jgi:hypothetical protein